jgi:hypothetical protein
MFNPDFKNKKVNYEMIHASIKSIICIITLFSICATCKLSCLVIETIFWNMRIIKYELLDISIMVSLLLTAFIIFMAFKGLSDELNTIFIKLNDSIIEKNAKIKELEEKLVTNNTKNQDETINNLTNLVINLNIEENIEEENVKQKKQYKKKKMC